MIRTRKKKLYNVLLKLWLVDKVTPKKLDLKKEIDCGMLQPKDKVD
jgi:hypothetical protein